MIFYKLGSMVLECKFCNIEEEVELGDQVWASLQLCFVKIACDFEPKTNLMLFYKSVNSYNILKSQFLEFLGY